MSRFDDDLDHDFTVIADRVSPSPDAWASIQQRIADREPDQETEIIMLVENTLTQRRWPLVAAAAAVIALAVGAIAFVNRDDVEQPADVPEPVPTPDIDSSLIGSTGGESMFFPEIGNGGYEVSVYDWDLALSDDLTSLTGVATLTATATQDLQQFSLDARELQIESVTVDGVAAEHSVTESELVITVSEPLTAGNEFDIAVGYAATPEFYQPPGTSWRGWNVVPGDQLVAELFGPMGATWTPVDHDVDAPRARYIMRLDVPDGFTATASGAPATDGESGDIVWDTGIGVLDATFAVAEFETNVVDGVVPIEVSVKRGSQSGERIERRVIEFLPVLESFFGPFPFERLGISALDTELIRAPQYSAPTRIVMAENTSDPQLVNLLASQWIGNAVATPEESTWLDWGLSGYAEAIWIESVSDDIDVDATTRRLDGRVPSTTRALDAIESLDDLYDADAGARAELFYHALRLEVGDEAFFTTIREFVQRNLNNVVTADDLRAVAEEISGQELDQFFTAWISETEVPQLPDTTEE